jgi:hypothetical protein
VTVSATAPTPIPFDVLPAQRSGSFQTSTFTKPAGYTKMAFQLTGMGTGPGSDYENPANGFVATIFFKPPGATDFLGGSSFGWPGGPNLDDPSDPPPYLHAGLFNIQDGSSVYVQVDLTGTFTVGVSGTIS